MKPTTNKIVAEKPTVKISSNTNNQQEKKQKLKQLNRNIQDRKKEISTLEAKLNSLKDVFGQAEGIKTMLEKSETTNIFICEICSNFYNKSTNIPGLLKCGHLMCKSCYDKSHKKCPVCRHSCTEFIQVFQLMVPAISSLNALTDELKSIEMEKDMCRAEYDSVKSKLNILREEFDPDIYQSKLDLIFQHYYKKEYLVKDNENKFTKISISELYNFDLKLRSNTVRFNFLFKGGDEQARVVLKRNTLKIPEVILLLFPDIYLKQHFSKYDAKMRTRIVIGKTVTIPYIFDLTGMSTDIDFDILKSPDEDEEEYERQLF
jgi:hypothetical protein